MAQNVQNLVDSDFASQNQQAQTALLRLFDRKLHKIKEAGYDTETNEKKTDVLCRWLAIKSKALQKIFLSKRDANKLALN